MMQKNVLEWLDQTVENNPKKVAYESEVMSITFEELQLQSKRIGSVISQLKLGKSPIAVVLGREVTTISAFLGVVYSGHAYAPLDASLPQVRMERILRILNPSAVIYNSKSEEIVKNCLLEAGIEHCQLLDLEKLMTGEICEKELEKVRNEMTEEDPLYVIFTSGSSGNPKGVMTSHHALMCYIEAYADVMRIEKADRLGCQSPLDYIAAIRDIYLPLRYGAYSYLLPKELFMQPDKLFAVMNEKKITCIGWSVSALTVLTSMGAFKDICLTELSKVCFSGSVMPGRVLKLWQQKLPNARFVNQYGPTEATASCTYYVVEHEVAEDEVLPIGTPYENYRIFLLNSDGTETGPGKIGEICVSGPILALGYYNDPERSKSSFIQNPINHGYFERIYRTGDFGRVREDGLLEYHGRMDRQIKHMGHRVELDEIEAAAMQSEGIRECVVLYHEGKEVIYLFYSGNKEKRDLILDLRKILPGFMIPRKVIGLDRIPKLPNGKMDMEKLKERMQ